MRKLLLLLSFFILTSAHADWASDREASQKQARIDYGKRVYGMSNSEATKKVEAGIVEGKIRQSAKFEGTSSDGSKIRAGATVTKTIDKAKVASTLVSRLGKAKEYAKSVGKASVPAFVGTAAFHGLMKGIDYVMDEGGKVTKKDTSVNTTSEYEYTIDGKPVYGRMYTACQLFADDWKSKNSPNSEYPVLHATGNTTITDSTVQCFYYYYPGAYTTSYSFSYVKNPNYQQPAPQVAVSDSELQVAVKNALESNNAALAAAIAEAIKDAYSPDVSQGQVIGDEATNGLASSSNADIKDAVQKAAANDGKTPGDGYGKPGYYKITDGEKTVEGYVYPSDTSAQTTTGSESTTATDPITGNQTTTGTSTGSLEIPPFCDWASIVCDWIGWTQQMPEDEEIELPEEELQKQEIKKDLIKASASSCPNDVRFDVSGLPFNITPKGAVEMQPICDTIEPLKYVFQLITFCFCAFMIVRL